MANIKQSPLVAKHGQLWQPTQDNVDEYLARCDEICHTVPQDFNDRVKILHAAHGALMGLVTCKISQYDESIQLAVLKRHNELAMSLYSTPPIQGDHKVTTNNVDTIQEEIERNDSETTNLTSPVDCVVPINVYQGIYEALAKDMDSLVMDSRCGLEAGDKNMDIVQPRRITSEELRLFQDPEHLHGSGTGRLNMMCFMTIVGTLSG